jgi:DNA-binding transcriptional ArsR family regulator
MTYWVLERGAHHGSKMQQSLPDPCPALTRPVIQPYGCIVQIAPPDFDRMFGALADHTRRDIVRRAISAQEGIVELASHYPMSFAAVQKHVAVLERAGLVTKVRIGRRKVVRTNLERLRAVRRLLDQYEELWRGRIDRMAELISDPKETDR